MANWNCFHTIRAWKASIVLPSFALARQLMRQLLASRTSMSHLCSALLAVLPSKGRPLGAV